jgi:hypothetical protein
MDLRGGRMSRECVARGSVREVLCLITDALIILHRRPILPRVTYFHTPYLLFPLPS